MVQLDPDAAAGVSDRHRLIDTAVRDTKLVKHSQCGAGEVAELGMASLRLEFDDDDKGDDDIVLIESHDRARIG
ncbi:unannotated protein [freshwater metagenome]|uniref:Unannotated protein n=1 Tax=freshwater metagenome TaxID=449393 RepID=A0A6J7P1F1_9ZZZZ